MGWAGWGIVAMLLITVPAACHYSVAQDGGASSIQFDAGACRQFVEMLDQAADARAAGIERAHYLAYLRRRMERLHAPAVQVPILLRELGRVWAPGSTREALALDLYTRCMTGPMGGEET